MFGPNTPMRLVGCTGKQLRDKEKRRVLVLAFQLQPFTPDMAKDLGVKGRLFATSTGDPLPDLLAVTLAVKQPPQRVELRLAPDQGNASVELIACDLSPKLVVRKDKEGPVFSATISLVGDYPSGDNLLLLMQRVSEQFFVTLGVEQGDMLARNHQPRLTDADEDDDAEEPVGAAEATH